jgi:hypothetical protein
MVYGIMSGSKDSGDGRCNITLFFFSAGRTGSCALCFVAGRLMGVLNMDMDKEVHAQDLVILCFAAGMIAGYIYIYRALNLTV